MQRTKPQNTIRTTPTPEVLTQATNIIIKAVQNEGFEEEVAAIASVNPQNDDGHNGVKETKRKL